MAVDMARIKHKRGDTINWLATYKVDDVPTSVAGFTIRCQVRSEPYKTLVGSLSVTLEDQVASPGQYRLAKSAADVAAWPVGVLKADIEYMSGESVFSTETFEIELIEDITQ
jgi:hypothetical protein